MNNYKYDLVEVVAGTLLECLCAGYSASASEGQPVFQRG